MADNCIVVQGLSKSFGDFLLDNVSFNVPTGRIVGFIGENGAGKSTTIKLILNELKRDAGRIEVFGRDNTNSSFKNDIGVVFDECTFHSVFNAQDMGKIFSGIYPTWDDELYHNYLKQFRLPTDKPIDSFSKGMKMKLGIAVAMSHESKLLMLDEATAGLDPVARDEIVEMLYDFTRDENHSVLISSHIVSDLEKLCDYIAFLHKGKLLLCEEKDSLLSEYGIVRCSASELPKFDSSAIIYKRESPYGVELIIRREAVPTGINITPVSIEELFVFMIKGAEL